MGSWENLEFVWHSQYLSLLSFSRNSVKINAIVGEKTNSLRRQRGRLLDKIDNTDNSCYLFARKIIVLRIFFIIIMCNMYRFQN